MMWNPLPATYLPNIDTKLHWIRFIFSFTKECILCRETEGAQVDIADSLGADSEGDDGGVIACEEVLPAWLKPRPLLPLRKLLEPRRLQQSLRLIFSHRKQQQEIDPVQISSLHFTSVTNKREGGGTGRVPTAWKAVGEALRKSTRSETTAAMGGGMR